MQYLANYISTLYISYELFYSLIDVLNVIFLIGDVLNVIITIKYIYLDRGMSYFRRENKSQRNKTKATKNNVKLICFYCKARVVVRLLQFILNSSTLLFIGYRLPLGRSLFYFQIQKVAFDY